MFDLTRTRYFLTKEVPVAPGATIANEGAVLKTVLVNGSETVQLVEGVSATEAIAGFSVNNAIVPGTANITETALVSSASFVQLSHGNLVAGQVYVYDVTGAAALTIVAATATPGANEVAVNTIAGQLTVAGARAGHTLQVRYRYTYTAFEQTAILGQRPINMQSNSALGTSTYIRGFGELYTDQYDVTVDFSAVSGVLYAGANGLITTDNSKTPIPGSRVVHVPSAADPFLGLTFNLA